MDGTPSSGHGSKHRAWKRDGSLTSGASQSGSISTRTRRSRETATFLKQTAPTLV